MIFLAIFPLTFAHFGKPERTQRFRLRLSDTVGHAFVEGSLRTFLVWNKRYTVLDFRKEPCYDKYKAYFLHARTHLMCRSIPEGDLPVVQTFLLIGKFMLLSHIYKSRSSPK